MSTTQDTQHTPTVLSMEVDGTNETPSVYRLRFGKVVKYLSVEPNTFTEDELIFLLPNLPPPPYQDDNWAVAQLSRDSESGKLKVALSDTPLAGVQNVWHQVLVNVLDLQRTAQLTASTFEAVRTQTGAPSDLPLKVIAKIARFEWEIPRIEQETRVYQLFQQQGATNIAPRFLGHIHEGGRVMGLLLEKLEDWDHASEVDFEACTLAVGNLHRLGLLHGDVNRYNMLVRRNGTQSLVKLIDFEHTQEGGSEDQRREELQSLQAELVDTFGRC